MLNQRHLHIMNVKSLTQRNDETIDVLSLIQLKMLPCCMRLCKCMKLKILNCFNLKSFATNKLIHSSCHEFTYFHFFHSIPPGVLRNMCQLLTTKISMATCDS